MTEESRLPKPRVVELFIASPGDVAEERDAVEAAAKRIEKSMPKYLIRVHRWEDLPATQGTSAQSQVERFAPDFKDIDIFVMILWQRYGTEIKGEGVSGTHREFRRAVESLRKHGK